jgi:hypothetical protein
LKLRHLGIALDSQLNDSTIGDLDLLRGLLVLFGQAEDPWKAR